MAFSLRDPAWRAALLSGLVWPGAGQLLNRQIVKGVAFILATLAIAAALVCRVVQAVWQRVLDDPDGMDFSRAFTLAHEIEREGAADFALATLALLAVWLFAIWDGWRSAPRPGAAPKSNR